MSCERIAALALGATITTFALHGRAQPAPTAPTTASPSSTPAAAAAPAQPAPVAPPPTQPTQALQPAQPAPVAPPPTQPAQALQPAQPAPVAPPPYGYAPPPYGYTPPPYGYAPPGYAMRGGFVPLPPPTLEYVEGKPIPPGYRVRSRTRTKIAIAGGSIFGGAYLVSVAGASIDETNHNSSTTLMPLVIPVAGPFITIGTASSEGAGTLLLILDGLAQTSGVVMFIAGLATEDTELVRNDILGAVPEINVGPGAASARWKF